MEKIIEFFHVFRDRFNELTAEEKRRLVIICAAGFAVLLILSIIISVTGSSKDGSSAENERARFNIAIPPEELFLPDEPDFLPGVVLERDRRLNWTEQDASEYWQDPLKYGEEQWREKIEAAVDELLERVP